MQPYTIAITGSQGKTNTSYILSKLLPQALITDTNLDTIYNVPITALKLKQHKQLAIFEMGIDRPHEMDMHLTIVRPNISLITGIAPVHADKEHLGSIENIVSEKRKMIEILAADDYAVLNYDDPLVRSMAKYTKAKILFYGSDPDHCQIYTDADLKSHENYSITAKGMQFNIYDQGEKMEIATKLLGLHQISNIMGCYLVFKLINEVYLHNTQNIREDFIVKIRDIKALQGRMSLEQGPQGLLILDDSLRANITSTKSGLMTFSQMSQLPGKKVVILGEMGEIGIMEKRIHKELGKLISELPGIDHYIGIGPLQKLTQEEAFHNGLGENKFYWAKDVVVAVGILRMLVGPKDTIYLKGSLLRHLERITMLLDGKDVGCSVTSCPLYNHCSKCKYLQTGYPMKLSPEPADN
jgi:UDP-N-acetylmuramoyl-tripeptide--D-alanyl-D-alanine ligase